MRPDQRIATELPLKELWDDNGPLAAERRRDLSEEQIRGLLRSGPIRFFVAKVGHKPDWVPEAKCFAYWKDQVVGHVADPEQRVYLDYFPGEYCFFASEWSLGGYRPIVVLERCH
jgi:hypothetical protein